MIGVGIHENIVIHKVTRNDKGSLVISVKKVTQESILDALNSGKTTALETEERDFLIYPISVTGYGGETDTVANIWKKISQVRDPLTHILSNYMPSDKIGWDLFKGTGITPDNADETIVSQDCLDRVYDNIVTQFIDMVTPFIGPDSERFRFIFIRSSKAKHYPKLRNQYLDTQPFMEPMSIPREKSRLGFTKYETSNGLDNGDPVVADRIGAEADTLSQILGNR
jgi:hypothetical protein